MLAGPGPGPPLVSRAVLYSRDASASDTADNPGALTAADNGVVQSLADTAPGWPAFTVEDRSCHVNVDVLPSKLGHSVMLNEDQSITTSACIAGGACATAAELRNMAAEPRSTAAAVHRILVFIIVSPVRDRSTARHVPVTSRMRLHAAPAAA